jgi:hypothetical protein
VQRVWKEHGLKPHLTRTFKLSNDPKFAEKVVTRTSRQIALVPRPASRHRPASLLWKRLNGTFGDSP